ncbi:MAG TPA: site-specific DNA-methyltransferase [Thermoanaerobaculia bacterium]|nr:site-specific DNA-methyltransferase [Thermoanaerobaculia bacterium]
MIIEGDNLQVLASLKSRYEGEVDVVYIDPPYNTGKDDFLYSDKRFKDPDADVSDSVYVTNEDGGRHTKWLNFMAPRLYMLWSLLKDTGVILVSINDVELFRLGMLLNEIFGEENWVGTIVWKGTTTNHPTNIALEHEYILCYAKSKSSLPQSWKSPENDLKRLLMEAYVGIKASTVNTKVPARFKAFVKEQKDLLGDLARYNLADEHGPYVSRRNLDKPDIYGYKYDVEHPVTKKVCRMPYNGWRYPEPRMKQLIKEGRILFGKTESRIPQLKVYLEEVEFPLRSVIELDARKGSNDLARLFGNREMFRNPKPLELMQMLLSYTAGKDSLVLDAFAGSGTTAEAVMSLNKRDGGSRRFILIEEGKESDRFCRSVTAVRVKKAIKKDDYQTGFTFYATGRKLDRAAIVGLERDALSNLICQADETGRGRGIVRLAGNRYVIGKNNRAEGICLVWNGEQDSEVTPEHLRAAAEEVDKLKLKRPFRIYGTFCRVADTKNWKFCQIPDDIVAQMHIEEESAEAELLNATA